ncbi:BTAD domain-containing putative transcriptional regulator [Kitasatospora sp. NA04385]|uniref:BTAD domain-containing putative transcriptional regulator n=1 Tax=Kitasatospora sp. NA04385 TaxID=2742135 RepID=UPI0020CB1999|nr:BTAD domain-containing putative transcriptional regulator [Kitasatospora sp. NA04385]
MTEHGPADPADPSGFGALLRELRTRAGINQQTTATRAGLSARALRDLEHGRVRRPRARTVHRLADALALTTDQAAALRTAATRDDHAPGTGRTTLLLLGPLLLRRGRDTVPIGSPTLHRLLGLLALTHPAAATRQEITDTLWPAGPPASQQSLVHTHVSRLRRLLSPDDPDDPAAGVVRTPTGYRLGLPRHRTDLGRFDDLLARTTCLWHAPDPDAAHQDLTRALRHWRGPVLADADPALRRHPAAVAANERRIRAALLHADTALLLRRPDHSVPLLRELAHTEPLHEGLHARLILTLAASGRQADALDTYTRLRTRLDEELGVTPGPELHDAHLRVLRGLPGPTATRPAPRATGEHWPLPHTPDAPDAPNALDAQPRVLPGPTAGWPPPRAAGEHQSLPHTPNAPNAPGIPNTLGAFPKPAQLPPTTGPFVGRHRQLSALDALLPADPDHLDHPGEPAARPPLLVVVGPPGIGKSALAAHWAHRHRDRFPDGQLFADLRGHSARPAPHPDEVLARFLRALGTPPDRLPADPDEAAALYRTLLADRRLLVLLDDARDAEQVRPLLPGAPGCAVLVTGRTRLTGLVAGDGARRLTLDPLDPAEGALLLGSVLGPCRVAAEPAAAHRLVRACGGLPLALRLAAADLTTRTTALADYAPAHPDAAHPDAALLARLDLADDPRTGLRAAFGHSYRVLPAPARRMFRLLGRAPAAGLTAATATALAATGPTETTALLDRLADAHLVREEPPGHYRLPGLLHPYAAGLAAEGDEGCGGGCGDGGSGAVDVNPLIDAHQQFGGDQWIDVEQPPTISGLTGRQHPNATATRVCDAEPAEAKHELTHRPLIPVAPVPPRDLASGGSDGRGGPHPDDITVLGLICWKLGRLPEAAEHFTQAARVLATGPATNSGPGPAPATSSGPATATATGSGHSGGASDREAIARTNLAVVQRALGRPGEAIRGIGEALPVHRWHRNRFSEAVALSCLSRAHTDLGDHATGRLLAHSALAAARAGRSRALEAGARLALADSYLRAHRPAEATAAYREALRSAEASGDRHPQAAALAGLAAALIETDPRAALRTAERALALARAAEYRVLEGDALTVLARVHVRLCEPHAALALGADALALHRATGHRPGETRTRLVLALAAAALGADADAVRHRREALLLVRATGGTPPR